MGIETTEPPDSEDAAQLHQRRRRVPHDPRAQKHHGPLARAGVPPLRARHGQDHSYAELSAVCRRTAVRPLIEPDAPVPPPADIFEDCPVLLREPGRRRRRHRRDRALLPGKPRAQVSLELERLEEFRERRIDTIHIVGGGTQNHLLCQLTADATNCAVVAGPIEATAIGNVLMQAFGTANRLAGGGARGRSALVSAGDLFAHSRTEPLGRGDRAPSRTARSRGAPRGLTEVPGRSSQTERR